MRLLAALLILTALAGCIGDDDAMTTPPEVTPEPEPVREPDWARAAIFGHDHAVQEPGSPVAHDHSDRSLHQGLSTPNFRILGHAPLGTDHHGQSAGGYYCGEVGGTDRRLAVVNSFTSEVALVVVDVTDPADPQKLGELVLPNTQIYDAAITDDGQFAVLATSPLAPITHEDSTTPVYRETPIWRDACGQETQGPEDVLPFVSGTLLVDLRDPTVPDIEDFVPSPAIGPHSVRTTQVDGVRYVVSSTTNLAYTASYFSIYTVDELVGQGKLVPYGVHSANYVPPAGDPTDVVGALALLNGHVDGTVSKNPATGETLAYLANWDGGLITVRLDGPGQLTVLSTWGARDADQGPDATGVIHSAQPLPELWNDRAVLITGQEVGGNIGGMHPRPTGQIVILDVTDPEAPEPLARWTLPVDFVWSGSLHFSTHYPAMVDDVLFVATYHGGLWAADASPDNWPDLPSLGVFIPAQEPAGGAAATDTAYAPYVLDVLAQPEGHLVVFDSSSGAYTVAFENDGSVTPAAPWADNPFIG